MLNVVESGASTQAGQVIMPKSGTEYLLEEEPSVTIKYLPTADPYHASFRLAEDDPGSEEIVGVN
jgi:hypothetical protein